MQLFIVSVNNDIEYARESVSKAKKKKLLLLLRLNVGDDQCLNMYLNFVMETE